MGIVELHEHKKKHSKGKYYDNIAKLCYNALEAPLFTMQPIPSSHYPAL